MKKMADINIDGESIFLHVANESQLFGDESDASNILISKVKDEIDDCDTSVQPETPDTVNQPPQLEHTEISHKKKINGRLKCTVCHYYTCASEERMTRHLRTHRGENRWKCDLCDYSSPNSASFQVHVNVHKGLKPHKCKFCDFSSASKSNTWKHELQKHHKNNPLKCKDCTFIGENQGSLKNHRKKAHKRLDERICKMCNRIFATAIKMKNHSVRPKKCKLCPFVTCTKSFYDKHLREDHLVKETVTGVKNKLKSIEDIKLFKCALCTWSTETENTQNILLHLIHHPNQSVNENIVDITVLRNCGIMQ